MSAPIYLMDGSGYIFRAFYAIKTLTNRAGFPTNALYGFVRMLLKLLHEVESPYVVAVFDAGRATFRTELYKEYKANRAACPEELSQQMPYFREFTRAFGLRTLELPGFEADDIIGTLSRRLAEAGHEVVIVGADKDLMQLVNDQVSMWDTMHDRHFREPEVVEKFGVPPAQVTEVLGLSGDTSDNIPGVDGVGPKTATQLIQKFKTVEGVIGAVEAIRNDASIRNRRKIAETIESDVELIRLSRRLVEIDRHTPVVISAGDGAVNLAEVSDSDLLRFVERAAVDESRLQELVEQFDFSSLVKDLKLTAPRVPTEKTWRYQTVRRDDFPAWLEQFKAQPEFSFDVETTSLDVLTARLVGISCCWSDEEAWYVPLAHRGMEGEQLSVEEFLAACGARFADPAVRKFGQNLKYDIGIMGAQGVEVAGVAFDSMIAAYVLNPDRSTYNLSALAREYLGRTLTEFDELVPEGEDFSAVDLARATDYCCQDAHCVWLLRKLLAPQLATEGLASIFDEVEMPLVPVLSRMERAGVRIDSALLGEMSREFAAELARIEAQLHELAGGPFNVNSPKQLSDVLFNRLGLSTRGVKRTKTGISTDSSVLEKLSEEHPLPGLILHYRMIHKLKSTYVDVLPALVSARTGRIHSRFNQTGTGTGRLSSSDPNLQNIPVQSAEGRRIRSAFIADPECLLISADYSQIELRLLAHMSGDDNLIKAFHDGVDIHARTARELLGLPAGVEVPPAERRIGKTLNFGMIYGMSGFRLARELGIPVHVANEYIERYFNNYPRVKEFFARVEHEAEAKGYVTTAFGRKRRIADIDTTGRDRGFVMRAALNAPIQGTAADLIKMAMVRIDRELGAAGAPVRMILQIHDELVFEAAAPWCERAVALIRREMEQVVALAVPLSVDVGWGRTWQEAQS